MFLMDLALQANEASDEQNVQDLIFTSNKSISSLLICQR